MMFLPLRFLSVLLLLLLLSVGYSDKYALVIGNSNYLSSNNLRNPRNDAEDLATALRSIGFNVSAYYDLGEAEMQNSIAEFSRQLSSDDIALFYFAGHGTQFQSQNYLIPVDANFNSPETLIYDSIKANDIVATIENTSSAVNIIIIDACRDPVFAANTVRTGVRGLAPMNAGRGTLIAFSTSPGEVAYDGHGRNSPYIEKLKELIINPEMDVEEIFRQTRYRVFEATANYERGSQQPEEYNRLSAPVHLLADSQNNRIVDSIHHISQLEQRIPELKQRVVEPRIYVSELKSLVMVPDIALKSPVTLLGCSETSPDLKGCLTVTPKKEVMWFLNSKGCLGVYSSDSERFTLDPADGEYEISILSYEDMRDVHGGLGKCFEVKYIEEGSVVYIFLYNNEYTNDYSSTYEEYATNHNHP